MLRLYQDDFVRSTAGGVSVAFNSTLYPRLDGATDAKVACQSSIAISGSPSGTLTDGETITQGTSSATAIVVGAQAVGPILVTGVTGSPDNNHVWTGGTSGRTFTPTAIPVEVAGTHQAKFVTATVHQYGWNLPQPNYAVEVDVKIDSTDDQCGTVYLLGRVGSSGEHYGIAWAKAIDDHFDGGLTFAANTLYLVKSTGSGAVSLASAAKTFTAGTTYRLRLALYGNMLQAFVNDVLIVAAVDTAYIAPGTAAFGISQKTTGGATTAVWFDNLAIVGFDRIPAAQAAYDEKRELLLFSLPDGGTADMQRIFVYHLPTDGRPIGDWSIWEYGTTCLFDRLSETGERQVYYGRAADSKVWQMDATATFDGAAIDAQWRSNWIEIGAQSAAQDPRRILERLRIIAQLAAGNAFTVTAEVRLDTDEANPVIVSRTISGVNANVWTAFHLTGDFLRFTLRQNAASGAMRLRRALLELLQ